MCSVVLSAFLKLLSVLFCHTFLASDVTTAIVGESFKCTGLLNLAAFAATAGLNPVLLVVQHFCS